MDTDLVTEESSLNESYSLQSTMPESYSVLRSFIALCKAHLHLNPTPRLPLSDRFNSPLITDITQDSGHHSQSSSGGPKFNGSNTTSLTEQMPPKRTKDHCGTVGPEPPDEPVRVWLQNLEKNGVVPGGDILTIGGSFVFQTLIMRFHCLESGEDPQCSQGVGFLH
ncbi:hypothetical protein BJY04DRAFT_170147 [Aspergillus karnatakaensis]|uniref:uncharacterized protein n=1 Tax=Aspergillus karnatakaensis TaxID=1810916 RepID=UPI003CCCEDF6